MIKHHYILAVLAVLALASGCSQKTQSETTEDTADTEEVVAEWPGMDEFHMVMAETYHPFKDSANLEPIKSNATELAQAAEEWVNAPLPGAMDTKEIRSKMEQLRNETADLQVMVNASTNEEIAASLDSVHHLFHEIQDAWYNKGKTTHEH